VSRVRYVQNKRRSRSGCIIERARMKGVESIYIVWIPWENKWVLSPVPYEAMRDFGRFERRNDARTAAGKELLARDAARRLGGDRW
jgi:hypothetical protein